ncbi:DNA-binding protein, partial [Ursidibacter arcticus]
MSENNLKTHYSAKELLAFSLSLLPNSVQGIIYQAKKQGWTTQKRVGKGGGVEYALNDLPEPIQTEIRKKFAVDVVKSQPKPLPAVRADVDLASLTNKQREIADARIALVQYVLELEQSMSRIKAVNYLCHLANSGELPSHLVALVDVANAKKKAESVISTR